MADFKSFYDSLSQKLKLFQDRVNKIEKAKTPEEVKMHSDFCETLKEGIDEYITYCENDVNDMKGLSKEQEIALKKQIQEAQDKFLQLREDLELKKKQFYWKKQTDQQQKKKPKTKKTDKSLENLQEKTREETEEAVLGQDFEIESKKIEEDKEIWQMDKQTLYKEGVHITNQMKSEAIEVSRNLNQIQEMAEAIVEKQGEQKEIMVNIENNLEEIESEMKRAQKQLKQIAKRLFTDKCILCLICLIICVVIFLIIYGAVKNNKGKSHFSIPKDKIHS